MCFSFFCRPKLLMKHDDGGMERMRLRERQPYGGGYEFYDKPMRSDEPKEVLIPYGNPTRGLLKECRTHIDQGGEIVSTSSRNFSLPMSHTITMLTW